MNPLERLPRLSRAQVAALNRLSAVLPPRGSWDLDLAPSLDAPLRARAGTPLWDPDSSPAVRAGALAVLFEDAETGARGCLEVDAALARGLVDLAIEGHAEPVSPGAPLGRAEEGVALYLAARALWSAVGEGGALRVVSLVSDEEPLELGSEPTMVVPLGLSSGPCLGHGWLRLSPPLLEGRWSAPLQSESARRVTGVAPRRLDGLSFPLHVVMGESTLCLAEWVAARVGDVLLLDQIWARPDGQGGLVGQVRLRLPGGPVRWRATLRSGLLTVDSARGCEMTDFEQDQDLPPSPEALLDELPLQVSVEVGRVPITAREVLALQPGQTLRLNRSTGAPVELRAGAKLLALGELVDVEGELAVHLTQLFDEEQTRRGG